MKAFDNNPQGRVVFTFAFAFTALLLLVLASQVDMPLRAILIALAFSDIIMLAIVLLGSKLPDRKK